MQESLSVKSSAHPQKKQNLAKYKDPVSNRHLPSSAKEDAIKWVDWVFSFSDPEKGISFSSKEKGIIHNIMKSLAQPDSNEKELNLFAESAGIFGTFYGTNEERFKDMKSFIRIIGLDNFTRLYPPSLSLLHSILRNSDNHKDISERLDLLERFIGMDVPIRQFADSMKDIVKNGDMCSIVGSMNALYLIPPVKYTEEMMELIGKITRDTRGYSTVTCMKKIIDMIDKEGLEESGIRMLILKIKDKYGSNIEMALAAEARQ